MTPSSSFDFSKNKIPASQQSQKSSITPSGELEYADKRGDSITQLQSAADESSDSIIQLQSVADDSKSSVEILELKNQVNSNEVVQKQPAGNSDTPSTASDEFFKKREKASTPASTPAPVDTRTREESQPEFNAYVEKKIGDTKEFAKDNGKEVAKTGLDDAAEASGRAKDLEDALTPVAGAAEVDSQGMEYETDTALSSSLGFLKDTVSTAETISSFVKAGNPNDFFKSLSGLSKAGLGFVEILGDLGVVAASAVDAIGPIKSGVSAFENAINAHQGEYNLARIATILENIEKDESNKKQEEEDKSKKDPNYKKKGHNILSQEEKDIINNYRAAIVRGMWDSSIEFVFDISEVVAGCAAGPVGLGIAKTVHNAYKISKNAFTSYRDYVEKGTSRLGIGENDASGQENAKMSNKLMQRKAEIKQFSGLSIQELLELYMYKSEIENKLAETNDMGERKALYDDSKSIRETIDKAIKKYNKWMVDLSVDHKITMNDLENLEALHKQVMKTILEEASQHKESTMTKFRRALFDRHSGKEKALEQLTKNLPLDPLKDISYSQLQEAGQLDYFFGKTEDALSRYAKSNKTILNMFGKKSASARASEFRALLKGKESEFKKSIIELAPELFLADGLTPKDSMTYEQVVDKFLDSHGLK